MHLTIVPPSNMSYCPCPFACICSYVCLPVCLLVFMSGHLSVFLFAGLYCFHCLYFHLPACLSILMYACQSVFVRFLGFLGVSLCTFACLSVLKFCFCLFVSPCVCVPVDLYGFLSFCLSVCSLLLRHHLFRMRVDMRAALGGGGAARDFEI